MGNGETILLVDDELHILNTSKQVLESLGYHVLSAKNGKEAVVMFAEYHAQIDLVLIDVVMPEMGGVEAVQQMMGIEPTVRVVYAIGYDKEDALPEHVLASDAIVLTKPYQVKDLSEVLFNVIHDGHHEEVSNWTI